MIDLLVERLDGAHDLALPDYQTQGASGLDVRAAVTKPTVMEPGAIALIPTGLRVSVPQGYEIQVRPRSGLALRHGVTVLNAPGTIDADYRGEVKIILINAGGVPFTIERGLRVAQFVVARVERVRVVERDVLPPTDRGAGGFGSTGKA